MGHANGTSVQNVSRKHLSLSLSLSLSLARTSMSTSTRWKKGPSSKGVCVLTCERLANMPIHVHDDLVKSNHILTRCRLCRRIQYLTKTFIKARSPKNMLCQIKAVLKKPFTKASLARAPILLVTFVKRGFVYLLDSLLCVPRNATEIN
jgi:hypothetical protein